MKSLGGKDYYSYSELVESFEVEVLVTVQDDNWQGDTRHLLRDGDRYGLLTFGWGSCSGCDALEACRGVAEVTELRDQLWSNVHWERDAGAMLVYIDGKDWALDYSYSPQFLAEVRGLLKVRDDVA
jgi:hypothetical protein